MKKLFLIRHAKSDWSDWSLDDFDRPLNKRGQKNAPFMGRLLKEKGICPNLIISSPAKRAKDTAISIANELSCEKIHYKEEVYEASLSTLLSLLKNIKDKHTTVFLVGHNPSLNALAYNLCGFNENIVTAGIVELECDIDSWTEIAFDQANLISFEYPKKYKKS